MSTPTSGNLAVSELRCEYEVNPLAVDARRPRLSWLLEAEANDAAHRGEIQTAYRIRVATMPSLLAGGSADLWDSGKVYSPQTVHVEYGGQALQTEQRAYWTVSVWDRDDRESAASEIAFWQAGILDASEWQGQWIQTLLPRYEDVPPATYTRKEFTVASPVAKATLHVTALGVYEPHLNGERVGDALLAPGWTDYTKRVAYQTYDVTASLVVGQNALGAIIGDGWYAGYIGWGRQRELYGGRPAFLAQLNVEYADGTRDSFVTDASWKASYGPITSVDLLMGESYDARLSLGAWASVGYDDSAWSAVTARSLDPKVALEAQVGPPVRITERIRPIAVKAAEPGTFVFDLGQNISGFVELAVSGPAGTIVRMRFGEMLNPDGSIYLTNIRAAKATDTYILAGTGTEVFRPHFTFHGFRYVEVTNYPLADGQSLPDLDAVTGCVIESDTEAAGTFECSHPMVNQLAKNVLWGQRGNFISIPTDCPQRDERLGWMGDAQVFIRTATYNRDVASFFTKWFKDVADAQMASGGFTDVAPMPERFTALPRHNGGAPAWADAGIIVPWTIAQVYGDTEVLRSMYEPMRRYFDYLVESNPNLLWANNCGNNFGDWLSIEADTDKTLLATAYFAYDARLMSQIAYRLGEEADAERYQKFFEEIKREWNRAYVGEDARILGDTQTAYLLGLKFDLLPEDQRATAARHLAADIRARGNHLSTGFIGVSYLCPVLTEMGYNDLAYTLLLNDTFPSWGYSIKYGATTIWERWDGWTEHKGFQTPDMNSFNHYSLGSVLEWLYRYAAGIDLHPSGAGYEAILLRPSPDSRLSSLSASYKSVRGTISSAWKFENGRFTWSVVVPPNTQATAIVPTTDPDSVRESGGLPSTAPGVQFEGTQPGAVMYTLGSGSYEFTAKLDG